MKKKIIRFFFLVPPTFIRNRKIYIEKRFIVINRGEKNGNDIIVLIRFALLFLIFLNKQQIDVTK